MNPKSCAVHSGTFHADEVTALALLLQFDCIRQDRIIRTRHQEEIANCEYVCDVGGIYDPKSKRFDHHQETYQGKLSSAGMVLAYLKEQNIINEKLYDYLHREWIFGVDQVDNGLQEPPQGLLHFSQIISSYMPVSYEATSKEIDEGFFQALEFVRGLLQRIIDKFNYIEGCSETIIQEMAKNQTCLYFDQPMPWIETFFANGGDSHPAKFLVMPSGNQWKLRGIPPSLSQRMKVRKPLPEGWAGKLGDQLKEATGIRGAVFCHKGRFISVWETKEDALEALKQVQESS